MTGIRYSVNADHLLVPNSVAREEVTTAPSPTARPPARPQAPRVRIEVTQEHIDSAEQRSSSHCMISDAIKDAVPNATAIMTDLQTIRWSDARRRLRYVYLTPQAAQLALLRFDEGVHTEPFTFQLRSAHVLKLNAGNRSHRERPPRDRRTPPMPAGVKQELVRRGDGREDSPEKVGGRTPPLGALAHTTYRGMRRTYGLRVLKP